MPARNSGHGGHGCGASRGGGDPGQGRSPFGLFLCFDAGRNGVSEGRGGREG